MIPDKDCTHCGQTFPRTSSFWYVHRGRGDGLLSRCKECVNKYVKWYRMLLSPAELDQKRTYRKEQYKTHKDRELASIKKYYEAHRSQILIYYKEWYETHKDYVLAYDRERHASNPERRLNRNRKRRALKRGTNATLTTHEWSSILEKFGNKCAYCREPTNEMDHVIPLSKGGKHSKENVVPACRSCNCSKRDKPLDQWLKIRKKVA